MNELNLDYDDDLAKDAEIFGQQIAQGDAEKLSHLHLRAPDALQAKAGSLEEALYITREVYGETNSKHSEMFYRWAQAVLEGGVDIKAAEEMLALLHGDKESFGGRLSWRKWLEQEHITKTEHLCARRHASICAMNVVHAVLNKFRGRGYMLWVERSLWRATRAEKDVKSER